MLTDLSIAMLGSALSIWNKGARLTGSGLSALPDLFSCAYMPVASTVLHQDAHRVPLQERMWHFVLSRLLLNLPVILKTISPGRGHHLHKHHSSYSTTASWVCMLSHHANAMKLSMLEQQSHTKQWPLLFHSLCICHLGVFHGFRKITDHLKTHKILVTFKVNFIIKSLYAICSKVQTPDQHTYMCLLIHINK